MRRLGGLAAAALAGATLAACSGLHVDTVASRARPTPTPTPLPGWLDAGVSNPSGVLCPTPDATYTPTTMRPRLGALAPPVAYDGGRLRIDPAPDNPEPGVGAHTALEELLTTAEIRGAHTCTGFGIASVTLQPGAPGVAMRAHRLTWVGITHGGPLSCPLQASGAPRYWGAAPVTVVLIDAARPQDVAVYTSRGVTCGFPPTGPTLAPAHQLLSVAFEELGGGVVAYQMPPCGEQLEASALGDGRGGGSAEVDVSVPFDPPPGCGSAGPQRRTTALSVPPGAEHAPVGPRIALQ